MSCRCRYTHWFHWWSTSEPLLSPYATRIVRMQYPKLLSGGRHIYQLPQSRRPLYHPQSKIRLKSTHARHSLQNNHVSKMKLMRFIGCTWYHLPRPSVASLSRLLLDYPQTTLHASRKFQSSLGRNTRWERKNVDGLYGADPREASSVDS